MRLNRRNAPIKLDLSSREVEFPAPVQIIRPSHLDAFDWAEGIGMAVFLSLDELFKGRHFDRDVVVLCVRQYLRFISSEEVRRVIRAEATKIETYNEFLDWVCFGGSVIKSGDPVEQEKQLKYASLVARLLRVHVASWA